jgi:hypothetical protein
MVFSIGSARSLSDSPIRIRKIGNGNGKKEPDVA